MRVKHMTDEELKAMDAKVFLYGEALARELFDPWIKKGSTVPVYEFGEDDELSS